MSKKFIVSDLDGTLLDNPKRLSQQYIDQLNELIDKGLDFTIATGRDMKKTKKAIGNLKIKYPVILTNGALLADLEKEKYLKTTEINNEIANEILELGKNMGIKPIVFAAYDDEKEKLHFNKGKWGKKYNPPILLKPSEYVPYKNLKVVSMQFHHLKERLDEMKKELEKRYGNRINLIYIEDVSYKHHEIPGNWYWLEVNSHQAGKDKMLKTLSDVVGRKLEDMVIFGDNYNDLEMMEIAGKSIAVEDSPSEVRNLADEICEKSKNGGVITYILKNKDFLN